MCIFIHRLVESHLLNDSILSVAVKTQLDFFKKKGGEESNSQYIDVIVIN